MKNPFNHKEEWKGVKLYEDFIRTNNVPAGPDLPEEYPERSINSEQVEQ